MEEIAEQPQRRRGRPRKVRSADDPPKEREQKILPENSRFLSADQIMEEFGITRHRALSILPKINRELEAEGWMTFDGKLLKSVWEKRIGG